MARTAALLAALPLTLAAAALPVQALAQQPSPAFTGATNPYKPLDAPRPLPTLPIADASGAPFDMAALKGRVVLLNLWATWCQPCVREMPALDRLQQAYPKDRLTVLALSLDRGGSAQVKPFFDKNAIAALDIYTDKSMASMRLFEGLRGLPTSYVIGPDGAIHGIMEGEAEWDSAQAKAVLEALMPVEQEKAGEAQPPQTPQ